MTAAEQKLDQVCAHLGFKVDAEKPLTLQQVSDGAVALSLIEHQGHIGQAAEALGVGRDRITGLLAPTERARHRRRAIGMVLPLVSLLLCLGCAIAKKPAARVVAPPPLPAAAFTDRSVSQTTTARAALAPAAPAKPWHFQWTGQTNGVVYVVGRKETLPTPWQVFARVTNRTEVIVTPGFYTVLQVEDTDNPNNVWIGR